ncbi:MAG: ATP-binding protein [Verrucomicrobiota bacterium]
MVPFLIFLASFSSGLFVWHVVKTRRLVRDLESAVRSERRLLLDSNSVIIKQSGFDKLVREVNGLVDRYKTFAAEKTGYSNQVEATLGSIREAVMIFDGQRNIEFANESAQRLFQTHRSLKGSRLESALRSTSLMEFLNQYAVNKVQPSRQISIEKGGELLWFEASCVEVQGGSTQTEPSTLLVLHDITRLKSLEVVRRDFVANVSHELRTPLTIIKGFAETLLEDNKALDIDSRARFLDKIVNNAQRLHYLVEDLLTLSRLESKPEQVAPGMHSLKQLFADTVENYQGRVDPDRQQIEMDFDERLGNFAFDRFRVNQVLDNLVENVFRYAPDFTQLKLFARLDPKTNIVECGVSDDGPGIPAKDVPHIFERFYRVDKGRSRERGGTGLGLSITKHIIQLHGGTVYAESELSVGTTIFFTLPYTATTEPQLAPIPFQG